LTTRLILAKLDFNVVEPIPNRAPSSKTKEKKRVEAQWADNLRAILKAYPTYLDLDRDHKQFIAFGSFVLVLMRFMVFFKYLYRVKGILDQWDFPEFDRFVAGIAPKEGE